MRLIYLMFQPLTWKLALKLQRNGQAKCIA